jgi:aromatic-L-amino-acid decarboxylase
MTVTSSLRLADREQVLAHTTELVLDSWRAFDRARPEQPEPTARHRALLDEPLPESGEDPRAVLDLAAELLDASFSPARPRWFAYVGSSGLEVGVLGDALAATHDVNVAIESGGADLVERQAIDWLADFTGFGPADGLLSPGGTISNLTALTAARERALPGIRHDGCGGHPMALYCSAEAHYSVVRAAEVLGIGSRNVRALPLDAERRADPHACAEAIAADRRAGIVPVAVVATAGSTLTGAVDDLDALADVCAEQGVWLHVDGAYGLPAAATALAGARFAGLARADSATVDAHKWLYVPKACSVLLVRDAEALERTFAHREAYIPHSAVEHLHPVDRTLEYSRPLRALKLWLAFRVHGATAIREAIERNLRQARLLAELVERHPSLEALHEPQLSALCFRHVACADDGDPRGERAAERTLALAEAIRRDGRILLAAAEVDGVPCLRACVVNHRTTDEDVHALVDVVDELAGRLG